uniref:Uncharacterized protein n=1 Tax=Myotis myotis TaxID=51298 RepID=A0A7J7UCT9_MYOMY|nr:hypothetical protein mMyoMyo1_008794 [Myotis myotis]
MMETGRRRTCIGGGQGVSWRNLARKCRHLGGALARPGDLRRPPWPRVESLKHSCSVLHHLSFIFIYFLVSMVPQPAWLRGWSGKAVTYWLLQTCLLTFTSPLSARNHFESLLLQEFRENPSVILFRGG